MSVGFAPTEPPPFDPNALTPDDQARIAAQMAQPAPAGLPPAPVTPAPPPAPSTPPAAFTPPDSAAIASKIATVGQPPVPTTPGPAPSAGAPPAPPAAAPAQPGTETPKQADELKAANDEAAKARAANDKAQIDFQKAQEPFERQRADIANDRVLAQQEQIRQAQEIQQRYQKAEDAAQQQIQASQDAIKKFKFRDYFADGEGGTNWVRKIGAALAAAAGAYGAGLTHGPNFALQILNKDMDDAHAHQVDELGKMKDEEVMQRTGLNDIRLARQKALADLTVNDAARDRLIATQLDQVAARQKTAEFAPGLAKFAAQLHQDATEKDALAKKQLVELNLKLQDESRKAHLDTASIDEKEALTKLHNVQAEAGGFARTAHKGAGGGGGTSSPAMNDAAATLSKMIAAKAPYPDLVTKAAELHFPLEAKTGHPSLKSLIAGAGAIGTQGAREERIDETKFKDFEKEHGLPKLEFTQHKLAEVLKKLDSGNPVGAMSSLMEFDAAAKGGTATEASMHAIQDHLGGLWSKLKGAVEKGETGNLGADQINTLRGAVKDALAGNKETVDKVHDAFGKQFDYSKPGVAQRAAGMFGPLGYKPAGSGGGAAPAAVAKVTAVRGKDGVIHHFDAAGKKLD